MAKFTFMLILVIDYISLGLNYFFGDIYLCQLFMIIMLVKVLVSY